MSKQENLIIMLNKLRTANTVRILNEESDAIYKDLVQTREEMVSMQENMEKEIFNIVNTMKILKDNNNFEELSKYIDVQHFILKKDLSDNDQEDRQVTIKIFK